MTQEQAALPWFRLLLAWAALLWVYFGDDDFGDFGGFDDFDF